MLDSDKPAFASLMRVTSETYRQPAPSKEVMGLWFNLLKAHDLDAVTEAFGRHAAASKFAPVPADILGLLKTREVNGHPEPNEAWAIALTSLDERASVCWTDAIAQALGAAQPILDMGDEIGGRMAFLEAYKRIIQRQAPVWRMSYGEDPQQRITAERQAVSKGLLPRLTPQTAGLVGGPASTEARKLLAAARAALDAPVDGETALERYQRQAQSWDAKAKQEWERDHAPVLPGIGHDPN